MVTKKNIAENKLFEALVQSVTDYVVAVSRDYKIIFANNLFKSQFNYQSGDLCYKAWKGKDQKCENCLIEMSFQDDEIHQAQETVVKKDGKSVQVLVKSSPIKDEDGHIAYVLETGTDITEKNLLEKKLGKETDDLHNAVTERLENLQKSEEKYRSIFEHSRDAILLTDLSGRVMEINQAAIEILGYLTKNDLMARESARDFFENPTDLSDFQNIISQKGFVTDFETRLKGNHGRVFDALMTSSIIAGSDGKNVGLLVIIRDITKRIQAQKQVEKQNSRLSVLNDIAMTVNSSLNLSEMLDATSDRILDILESDSVRIYLLDEKYEYLILTANKGHSKKFISKRPMKRRKIGDGMLGQTILTGETRVADNILRSKDPYVDSFIEEGLKSTVYIPLASKGEAVGVMCVSSHSLFEFSKGYVAFLTVIGNQIGVAVENANLYEDIKRAYIELKEAQEQVVRSEKLASLGKLAATIAHEINNPLSAVLTYIRLMIKLVTRDRFGPDRLPDIQRYLDTMEKETARCGEIVKNLLDFSRQSKISIGTHSIEEIIDRALVLISHELEINSIQLKKEIASDLPMVKCDFKQIQQTFLNLLSNASEAMTKGGVLTLQAKHSQVEGFLEIVISDTGCGITKEDLKNIFEPFFTTKEEGKGVGLGLSVVYGIITKHNGTIDAVSEPLKGTSFIVKLPMA